MEARYRIEKTSLGWSVIDTRTEMPATVQGVPQEGLSLEDADDLADLLSHIEAQKDGSTTH